MLSICVVFEVEGRSPALPSSYFFGDASTEIVKQLIQKVLEFYKSFECSAQVLMGRCVEEVTQSAVISVDELFKFVKTSSKD